MTHEVVLQGYNVKPGSLQLGTFDSYGIEKIHVTADDSWDGLAIVVTFNPPEGDAVEVRVPADGTVKRPLTKARAPLYFAVLTAVYSALQKQWAMW